MKGQNWPLSDTENIIKISRYFLNIAISRYFQMMQYIAFAIYRDTKRSSLLLTVRVQCLTTVLSVSGGGRNQWLRPGHQCVRATKISFGFQGNKNYFPTNCCGLYRSAFQFTTPAGATFGKHLCSKVHGFHICCHQRGVHRVAWVSTVSGLKTKGCFPLMFVS